MHIRSGGDIIVQTNNAERFYAALQSLKADPAISRTRKYTQHKGTTTFQHCWNVAVYSFYLAEKLRWKIDEYTLARGAMLHDYYLYTVHEEQARTNLSDYQHGKSHPQLALENARKEFHLNPKEENIIRSHMWPLTLFHIPKCKEAWLVCMTDKYCALREMYGDTKAPDPYIRTPWIRDLASRKIKHVLHLA